MCRTSQGKRIYYKKINKNKKAANIKSGFFVLKFEEEYISRRNEQEKLLERIGTIENDIRQR